MHILLAAATPFEIQPVTAFLTGDPGRPAHLDVQPLITGVGAVPTSWSLMHQIGKRRPDMILQAGIAGCFDGRSQGDVLAIREEIWGDLGVWEQDRFRDIFDLQLAQKEEPPYSNGLLMNPYAKLLELSGCEPVRSITVHQITTDPRTIRWYQQNWLPVVESMEGGSLHYVCLRESIPFLQIRAVSNAIGERDKKRWDIPTALRNLNDQLIHILKKLDQLGTVSFSL